MARLNSRDLKIPTYGQAQCPSKSIPSCQMKKKKSLCEDDGSVCGSGIEGSNDSGNGGKEKFLFFLLTIFCTISVTYFDVKLYHSRVLTSKHVNYRT